ncbi:MAG: hypothetical protein ACFHW5_22115 [Verrucomicrobiota bacterium]
MRLNKNHPFLLFLLSMLIGFGSACKQDSEPVGGKQMKILVGISPFLPEKEREEVFGQLMLLVLDKMPLNASLVVYDAFHIQTISTFDIPNRNAFRSTRTRLNQFKKSIQLLRFFLQPPSSETEGREIHQQGAIRFPQWSDFIGKNQILGNVDTRLVVLGNPLYIDVREPAYSMHADYFPSDGHIHLSARESVYGTIGKEKQLLNIPVHWGYLQEPWINPAHEEAVSRFWKLYTQNQGGHLETFCLDLQTVFERLMIHNRDTNAFEESNITPLHTRVEMIRIQRQIGSTDWITSNLTRNGNTKPPTLLEGPIKIGIRWRGEMDLDLYAKSDAEAETLFFEHPESQEGYYYKDHRQSPDREFEFIEYHQPIQLNRIKVWVNFFEGQTVEPPEFEARIEFDRQIYSRMISIPSLKGNQGQTGSDHEDCWVEVNLIQLMGIPASPSLILQERGE